MKRIKETFPDWKTLWLFTIASAIGVASDFVIFLLTVGYCGRPLALALSYPTGVIITFFINIKVTFKNVTKGENRMTNIIRFMLNAIVHGISWGIQEALTPLFNGCGNLETRIWLTVINAILMILGACIIYSKKVALWCDSLFKKKVPWFRVFFLFQKINIISFM